MKVSKEDIRKALRKGQRDAELEVTVGFTRKNTVFASEKTYRRRKKHKIIEYNDDI